MSETEQDQKVAMGEAVSPEDAGPCVIGDATATMMIVPPSWEEIAKK
jgi:hypothetical protein